MKIRIGVILLAAALAAACGKQEAPAGGEAPRISARLATVERAELIEQA